MTYSWDKQPSARANARRKNKELIMQDIIKGKKPSIAKKKKQMNIGNIAVNEASGVVKVADAENGRLMCKAVLLLKLLSSKPGVIFSKEEIMKRVWNHDNTIYVRSMDVSITHIRQAIKGSNVEIVNQKGVGYKLLIN